MASHKAYLPFVSSPVARKRYTSPTTATVRPWAAMRTVGFWLMNLILASRQRSVFAVPDVVAERVLDRLRLLVGTRSRGPQSVKIEVRQRPVFGKEVVVDR